MIVRRVSASMGTSAAPLDGSPERLGRWLRVPEMSGA